jgi:hypothetical protein
MNHFFNLFCRWGLMCFIISGFWNGSQTHADQSAAAAAQASSEMRSLSGRGDNFEVIVKFAPFSAGSEVSLIAYVLASDTNEPIRGAIVSGGMSGGTESLEVVFTEKPQPLAGVYTGRTIHVARDKPYSWLFDIALGDKSDLVAIDGFQAGDKAKSAAPPAPAPHEPEESVAGINLTPVEIVVLIAAFAALQAAIFVFIRRRCVSGSSAKEPR